MASLYPDAKGHWKIQFVMTAGKRRTIHLGAIPKKESERIKTKVEAIVAAQIGRFSLDGVTAEWVGNLPSAFYGKLVAAGLVPKRVEPEQSTVRAFVDRYIASRTDVKGSTAAVYGHTRRNMIEHFGPEKVMTDITAGDADDFRLYLSQLGLSENTVRRRCSIAKQFCRAAVRRRMLKENPFGDMRGISVRGNKTREFFVPRDMADRVLAACPDAQWQLLFALSRYGGLRCPSEHLALRWGDIDWAQCRITVRSSKTEHHEGGESRQIPLFPELRNYLERVYDQAEPGTEFVITRYRQANANLRTQLNRIIRKAGLVPWPKLFQNLRATRETELAEKYPLHVVCSWIGNTQAVAAKHYLQVTQDHFDQAACSAALQHGAELSRMGTTSKPTAAVFAAENLVVPLGASREMGGTGLEPVTSTV